MESRRIQHNTVTQYPTLSDYLYEQPEPNQDEKDQDPEEDQNQETHHKITLTEIFNPFTPCRRQY